MKTNLCAMILVGLLISGSSYAGPAVTQAKSAELSLHRVERLVVLKKIEEAFQNKLKTVRVEALAHQGVDQPAFKATITQVASSDGSSKAVEILLTEEGRALSHALIAGGGEPKDAPEWPDKDAATLAENALHYVLDNSAADSKLLRLNQGFSKLTLTQVAPVPGSTRLAEALIEAASDEPVLKVYLRADGTVESAEFASRQ